MNLDYNPDKERRNKIIFKIGAALSFAASALIPNLLNLSSSFHWVFGSIGAIISCYCYYRIGLRERLRQVPNYP